MSDKTLTVSIIIPHWNNVEILSDCLESISSTTLSNFEIIVVDNASSDHSVNWVKFNHPRVNLIENDKNYGYAGGCNIGANHAKGENLVFLNNDTVQEPDCIPSMLKTLNTNLNIGAVQPKVLNYFDRTLFDYAGGVGGHMDIYCFPFARGRLFTEQENDRGQYDNKEKCFWASGTCFMIRKNLFHKAGGFDDVFFAHMEEIDLCWRAFNLNLDVKYIGTSTVYHVGGATLNTTNPKKTYLNFRNNLFTITKNAKGTIFTLIILRMLFDGIAAFKFLLELKPNHFFAIFKAHISYYGNLSQLLKKRKMLNQAQKYYSVKSIVWSYFVYKKTVFNRL